MDQSSPNRTDTKALAAKSAEAVRALRDRAQRALGDRQEQLAELEKRIATQLEIVSEELARDAVSATPAPTPAELEALDSLRSQLLREQAEWEASRHQQEAELSDARKEIEQLSSELTANVAALDAREAELSQQQAQLATEQSQSKEQLQALQCERAKLEAAVAHFKREQESTAQADHEELNQLEQELESERASWQAERQQLERSVREQSQVVERLREQLEEIGQRNRDLQESTKTDVASVRNEMAAQTAEWHRERVQLKEERNTLADELRGVRSKLDRALQQETAASNSLEEVVTKFELAMEDVRRLRGRVAELEEELAARPTVDLADLPELIHLRAERDALVEKVAALENRLTNAAPAKSDQETDDLRRRFELAVDDVRQLKTEKAKLEEQLAVARRSPALVAETGLSDWEAQKRKLIASLEGEESPTPDRRKERTSIEGTIRITDEVVAEKDREIEALRKRLEASNGRSSDERAVETDECFMAERERLVTLEAELHEKLRAAELELSTSRAKLTRQDGELEKLRRELEVFKQAGLVPTSSGGTPLPPRRRWLDKLGLGGDEEK